MQQVARELPEITTSPVAMPEEDSFHTGEMNGEVEMPD
jgi:hypothetical protein